MEFSAELQQAGKTATGIEVPPEVIDALGGGRRPAVTVGLGAHRYRSTVGVMGGRFMIPVSAENRRLAGIEAGQVVDVTLELDSAPRVVEVPPDLQAALSADPAAQAGFAALSYSGQRAHVESVEGAKTTETRVRRVAKVVAESRLVVPKG